MSEFENKDLAQVFEDFNNQLKQIKFRLDGLENNAFGAPPKTKETCEAQGGTWNEEAKTCTIPRKPIEKTGEILVQPNGTVVSVLPQGTGEQVLRPLKVCKATGEIYRQDTEAETDEFVEWFLGSGLEHQREGELAKQRAEKRNRSITPRQLEGELTKQKAELRKRYLSGEDLKE